MPVQTIRRKDLDKDRLTKIMTNNQKSWLNKIPPHIGHYLTGFTDGEGSFSASLRKRKDHTMGWQIALTFNVSQRDKTVLVLLKRHLGCGRLTQRRDGVWNYTVHNVLAISDRIIPFFQKYKFLSSKSIRNFSLFRRIVKKVINHDHLTSEGLKEILILREELNKGRGRKRKYAFHDYLKSLSKNPQRLYARPRAFRDEKHKRG